MIEVDEETKREAHGKRVIIDKATGKPKEVDIYDRTETKKKVDPEKARAMLSSNLEQSLIPADLSKIYYYPIFKTIYDDFNKRNKDLEIFQNISENYKSLDVLLADMAIEPIIDSVVDIEAPAKENEFLTLSTIHSAKGLEWHSVFVIHAVDGYFPSSRSAETTELLEEERRLMYVSVTRAKQNLFITFPMNLFDRQAGVTLSKPSRFISELNSELAEGFLIDESSLNEL